MNISLQYSLSIGSSRQRVSGLDLLGVMAIFFVPFGVGLMESYKVLAESWFAIVVSCALSTWIVIATVALIYQKLNKRS